MFPRERFSIAWCAISTGRAIVLASLDIGVPSPGIGFAGRSTTLDKFAMVRSRVSSKVARPVNFPLLLASGTITHGGVI